MSNVDKDNTIKDYIILYPNEVIEYRASGYVIGRGLAIFIG